MSDPVHRLCDDSNLGDQTAAPDGATLLGEQEVIPNKGEVPAGVLAVEQSSTSTANPTSAEMQVAPGSDESAQSEATRPRFSERPPDVALLTDQLLYVTRLRAGLTDEKAGILLDGSVGLYLSFDPQDAKESALARLIVAATNASMDCFGLAAQSGQSDRAREPNLKLGFKGAETVKSLIEMFDSIRRRGPQNALVGTVNNVTVGEVTVEKGGQAIIGTIDGEHQRKSIGPELAPPERKRGGGDE